MLFFTIFNTSIQDWFQSASFQLIIYQNELFFSLLFKYVYGQPLLLTSAKITISVESGKRGTND